MSHWCCANQCSSWPSRLFLCAKTIQIRNKINRAGKQSRRTWIVVQIGIASALAPDRVPGGVLRPGELRGTSRIQVDWARSDRTTARGRDDTHGDIESMHDGHCIYIALSLSPDEGGMKRHARTIESVEIPRALESPLRHGCRRHSLHGARRRGREWGCELGYVNVIGKGRTVPVWGSHWSPPLQPPSRQPLVPAFEEKLQFRRP